MQTGYGPDSLRLQDGGSDSPSLHSVGVIPGVWVNEPGGGNQEGTGTIRNTGSNGRLLAYKGPDSNTWGPEVHAAQDGEYVLVDGENYSKYIRVQVYVDKLEYSDAATATPEETYATGETPASAEVTPADQISASISTTYYTKSEIDALIDTYERTDEEIYDLCGAMITGGTQTLITVTHDDPNNQIDFVVEDDLALYDWSNADASYLPYGSGTVEDVLDTFNAGLAATLEPTGFSDPTDSTISFVAGTRTFSIAPVAASFEYLLRGAVNTVSSQQDVVLADTTGTHFIYFDSGGTLTSSLTPWTFTGNQVFVGIAYWRAGGADALVMEERHQFMPWSSHRLEHNTAGARFSSGLAGTFNDNNTFQTESGVFYDEDIELTPGTETNCRLLYRDGSGDWYFDAAGTDYFKEAVDIIQYDDGSGTPQDVGNNNYVAYWIFATNDIDNPIWSIMGQRTDNRLINAQANNTLSSLDIADLPTPEMKILYRVIVKRSGTNETVEDVSDYRASTSLPLTSYVPTSHSSLSQLAMSVANHTFDTDILPVTDDAYDLGSALYEFKDLYLDGTAYIDTLEVHVGASFSGNLDMNDQQILNVNGLEMNAGGTIYGEGAIQIITAAAGNMLFDAGGVFQWRDVDAANAVRMQLNSSDAQLVIGGAVQVNPANTKKTILLPSIGGVCGIAANAFMDFYLDYDENSSNTKFRWFNHGTTSVEIMNLSEAGVLTLYGNLEASADDTYDLGAAGTEFKDLYIDGTAYLDTVEMHGNINSTGHLAFNTAAGSDVAFDFGGIYYFRDIDDGDAVRMTLTSATGALEVNGTIWAEDEVGTHRPLYSGLQYIKIHNSDYSTNRLTAHSDDGNQKYLVIENVIQNGGIPSAVQNSILFRNGVIGAEVTRLTMTYEGHFVPGADDAYDLGASGYEFKDLYIDGIAYVDTLQLHGNVYSVGDLAFNTAAASDVYFDFGGFWYFRDIDAADAVKATIDSSTGNFSAGAAGTGLARIEAHGNAALDGIWIESQNPSAHIMMTTTSSPASNIWSIMLREIVEGDFQIYNEVDSIVALYFKGDGKTGLGTTDPDVQFHVEDAAASAFIKIESGAADSNAAIQLKNDARQWQFYLSGSDADAFIIRDSSGGVSPFRINVDAPTGSMLIGSTGDTTLGGDLFPSADDTYDLGAAGSEWKDLYLDGTAYIDTLEVHINAQVAGVFAVGTTPDATAGMKLNKSSTDVENYKLGYWTGINTATGGGISNASGMVFEPIFRPLAQKMTNIVAQSMKAYICPIMTNEADEAVGDVIAMSARTAIYNLGVTKGTVTNSIPLDIKSLNNENSQGGTLTFTNSLGIRVQDIGTATGNAGVTITSAAGVIIWDQTGATNKSNLIIGYSSIPAGDFSIYNASANPNAFTGTIQPIADDTTDLGAAGLEFKDLYLDGTAYIDTLEVHVGAKISTALELENTGGHAYFTLDCAAGSESAVMYQEGGANRWEAGRFTADNFEWYNYGTSNIVMTMLYSNDYVGIGTRAPDERFVVTGGAGVNTYIKVECDPAQWCGIWFDDNAHRGRIYATGSDTLVFQSNVTSTFMTGLADGNVEVENNLVPSADDANDLGTGALEWKDLYLDGTAYIDTLQVHVATLFSVPLYILEQAAASADVAGLGQIWVKNTAPNELWFTDDAGTDFQLGLAAAGATAALDNLAAVAINTSLISDTDDTDDLGSAVKEWKDLYIDGTAYIDTLQVDVSAIFNGPISGTYFKDENDMASDAADAVASQQSIKAYVDTSTAASGWLTVYKANGQSNISDATLNDDNDLLFAMAASKHYSFEIVLFWNAANATPDIQVAVNGPAAGTSIKYHVTMFDYQADQIEVSAIHTAYESAQTYNYTSTPTSMIYIKGVVRNGANAGDFILRHAQGTSNAAPTTVEADSYMKYKLLN